MTAIWLLSDFFGKRSGLFLLNIGWQPCSLPRRFVSCRNVTGFSITLVVTYSETDSVRLKMQVDNVRKLHFQAYLAKFCQRQKAEILWRLSFRMGSFAVREV